MISLFSYSRAQAQQATISFLKDNWDLGVVITAALLTTSFGDNVLGQHKMGAYYGILASASLAPILYGKLYSNRTLDRRGIRNGFTGIGANAMFNADPALLGYIKYVAGAWFLYEASKINKNLRTELSDVAASH